MDLKELGLRIALHEDKNNLPQRTFQYSEWPTAGTGRFVFGDGIVFSREEAEARLKALAREYGIEV